MLEGGSIHVDGEGTVLTTEECLLNPNRNPDLSREQIEAALHDYLGAEKVVWLGRGVYNDETDGHVDNLACFVRPGVVLLTWSEDESDPQHEISRDALERLEAATDARGRALRGGQAPLPRPADDQRRGGRGGRAGRRDTSRAGPATASPPPTPTSTSATTRIVFPLLDERHDEAAAEILRGCFPEREVVGVPAREILLGGGNIHCITQQVPATRSNSEKPTCERHPPLDSEGGSEVHRLRRWVWKSQLLKDLSGNRRPRWASLRPLPGSATRSRGTTAKAATASAGSSG